MKKIITFFLLCFSSLLFSQVQYLDTNFGNQGKATESFPDLESRPEKILPLKNGGFLLLSYKYLPKYGSKFNLDFYFSRYDANGQLDTSFGIGGFVIYPLTTNVASNSPGLDLIRLNDDGLLALCVFNNTTKLIKFTSIGDIDSSFGLNGEVNLATNQFNHILQTSDNNILLIGQYFDGYNNMYQFARMSTSGVLDNSFGTNGTKKVDPTSYRFDIIRNVKYTFDDKILIVGASYNQATKTNGVITRFSSTGDLDMTFGINGTFILNMSMPNHYSWLEDINVQSDGTIITCGKSDFKGNAPIGLSAKPILAKLHSNGTIVQQFGLNGIMYFDVLFQGNDSFLNVCFDDYNRILVTGNAQYPYPYTRSYYYFRLLNNNGTDATDFGNNGILYFNLSSSITNFSNYITKTIIIKNEIYGLGWTSYKTRRVTFFKLAKGTLNVSAVDKEKFTIFPNPVNTTFFITGQNNQEIEKTEVFDINGRSVKKKLFNNESNIQVDISNLASGIYTLNIHTVTGNKIAYKLIKK